MHPTARSLLSRWRFLSLVWLAFVLGCGRTELVLDLDASAPTDGDIPPDGSPVRPDLPRTLVSISLSPPQLSLPEGTSQAFTVTGIWSDGSLAELTDTAVFSVDDPRVLSLLGNVATARGPGVARVSASTPEGLTAVARVMVPMADVRGIVISPSIATTGVGASLRFTSVATLSDGSRHDVSPQVRWQSSDPTVALLDATGLARALSPGTVTVTATLPGARTVSATAGLTITAAALASITISPDSPSFPSGVRQPFVATGTYTDGRTADVTGSVRWSSSIPSVVSVSPSGEALMGLPGRATLSASLGRVSASTMVTVTAARLVSIDLQSLVLTLPIGTSRAFRAVGTYSDGSSADLTNAVVWSSSDTAVASASNTPGAHGVITALAAGTTTVSATAEGVTGSATVTVTSATLARLSVLPSGTTVPLGVRLRFTATASYSDGSSADVTPDVVWTSASSRIVLLGVGGLGASISPGTTVVTAALGRISGSTEVTVSPAALVSLRVTPSNSTVPVRGTAEFRATGQYSDGTLYDLTDSVVWDSTDRRVAGVVAGRATGLSAGTVTVVARYFSQFATATLRVTSATLTSIDVTPSTASLSLGGIVALQAIGTFSDHSTADVTPMASWTSSGTSVASVSNLPPTRGVVGGISPGTATITASVGTLRATASIVVSGTATLTSLEIDPLDVSIPLGTRRPVTAIAAWSDGVIADVSSIVSWEVSDPAFMVDGAWVTSTALASGTLAARLGPRVATASLRTLPRVTSIAIAPSTVTLPVAGRTRLRAFATLADGTTADVTRSVVWSSSLATVASVTPLGSLSGTAAGRTTVTAALRDVSATANVTITDASLREIQVTPLDPAFGVGVMRRFRAIGLYSDGSTSELTESARWTSSASSVLSLEGANAAARTPGTAVVEASWMGISGVSSVTVTAARLLSLSLSPATRTLAPLESTALRATATWSDGSVSDVTASVVWRSDAATVAVSNASSAAGVVTARMPGVARITAALLGVSASATVSVSSQPLRAITLRPSSLALSPGQSFSLTAVGRYADDSLRDVTALVRWRCDASGIASLSSNTVTAISPGSARVSASLQDVVAEAPVVVSAATLRSISLAPSSVELRVGDRARLVATGSWSDGSTASVTEQCVFDAADATVAVSNVAGARGELIAREMGSVTVSARCLGLSTSAAVTVTSPSLVALVVTPTATSVPVGFSVPFSAVARYSDGSQRNVTGAAVWTSTTPVVASIDARAVATPRSAGSTLVSATYMGMSADVALTVTPATALALSVTPTAPTLSPGVSLQLQAVATFSDGTMRTVTDLVSWRSTAPGVLSFSAGAVGRAIAVGPGVASVTAVWGDVSGGVDVTISAATLAGLSVSPRTADVPAGAQRQFSATASYSDGSTRDVTAASSWTSSNAMSGTVSDASGSRGLFTARSPGSTVIASSYMGLSARANATVTPSGRH